MDVDPVASSSTENEETPEKHQRPTSLFSSPEEGTPRVTFEHTIPIIETPSTQQADFSRATSEIFREPSPVELLEPAPEIETLESQPIIQEPELEEPSIGTGPAKSGTGLVLR